MKTMRAVTGLITEATGARFFVKNAREVGGGCINRCFHIAGDCGREFFVKLNAAEKLPNLLAEQSGLLQLAAAGAITVPAPVAAGMAGEEAALVLEYMRPAAKTVGGEDWRKMGADLARLHNAPPAIINAKLSPENKLPEMFGLRLANATLGNLPGFVGESEDWGEWFVRHRLQFQFNAALRLRGREFSFAEQAVDAARELLSHKPAPSLVHGDLWGGNAGFFSRGEKTIAAVFDPAPYIGDAETDIAMSELFGGFAPAFYEGYRAARVFDENGYRGRRDVYNLYHVLNHFNLFGGAYLRQAEAMIASLARGRR